MPDGGELRPQDDIHEALETANQLSENAGSAAVPGQPEALSDTLTQGKNCPLLGLRYALARCGLMAEKYPWQTLAALAITIGCGWLCDYFGLTVLAALILYAVYAED